jgi:hypothetical protein
MLKKAYNVVFELIMNDDDVGLDRYFRASHFTPDHFKLSNGDTLLDFAQKHGKTGAANFLLKWKEEAQNQ